MISNLRLVCQHLASENSFDSAIEHLSLNVCISGKPSRVYIGQLNNAAGLKHLASVGFGSNHTSTRKYQNELLPLVIPALTEKTEVRITNHDSEYHLKFRQLIGHADDKKWKSTVFLTSSNSYLVALSSQIKLAENPKLHEYYDTLNSILRIYLNSIFKLAQPVVQTRDMSVDNHLGQKLSERQELILSLIRAHHTNKYIANRMGYSESLIRQESIMIYKKLGVAGRKDLQE